MSDAADATGTAGAMTRLASRVAERRANGDYPEGLEEELSAHFQRIVHHRGAVDPAAELMAAVETYSARMVFDRTPPTTESATPGMSALHKTVNKALARQNENLFNQLQSVSDALRDCLRLLAQAVGDGSNHRHPDLIGLVDAVNERLTSYERSPVDDVAQLGDLRRRLEVAERRVAELEAKSTQP